MGSSGFYSQDSRVRTQDPTEIRSLWLQEVGGGPTLWLLQMMSAVMSLLPRGLDGGTGRSKTTSWISRKNQKHPDISVAVRDSCTLVPAMGNREHRNHGLQYPVHLHPTSPQGSMPESFLARTTGELSREVSEGRCLGQQNRVGMKQKVAASKPLSTPGSVATATSTVTG